MAEPGALTELFATADAADRHADLVGAAAGQDVPVHLVSGEVMTGLAQTQAPQGLVGVARFRDVDLAALRELDLQLVVVLAAVRDPGNAGTVLRAADAAGATAVIFAESSVDPYNSKCIRASAGSAFHVPFVRGVSAEQAVAALRAAGLTVLAAAGESPRTLDELTDAGALSAPTAWLFGNEAWGLPEPLRRLADSSVAVPIYGRAESLNLATAAAVCLYASARAQRSPGTPSAGGDSGAPAPYADPVR